MDYNSFEALRRGSSHYLGKRNQNKQDSYENISRARENNFTYSRNSQAYINFNSKYCQTELTGEVVKKPKIEGLIGETIHT